MKLVIIEGPGKKDTIKKYLGSGFQVLATKGHVRDLPQKAFGVDLDSFEPQYEILPDKKDVIEELKKASSKASQILLATDPDREGEAISWHIAKILGLSENEKCRIVFNEISSSSVQKALTVPRTLDKNLINAQQARRILDRIVGYKISPIVSRKIKPKLSAGRVQSVALKLVVEREDEINKFKPEEFWSVIANLSKLKSKQIFKSNLFSFKGKKEKPKNKEEVDLILNNLKNGQYKVKNIKKSKVKSKPPAPFTTSTMQQDALNKLGMSIKKTSFCAQQLYEGVELGGEGKTALITYIRSDSTRVSPDAQKATSEFAIKKFGKEYVPEKPNIFSSKGKVQDAHEAIRPISITQTPENVKKFLSPDNFKLYKLIYERFLASQMSEAIFDSVEVEIICNDCIFKASGKTVNFPGWTIVYKNYIENEEEEEKIPKLEVDEILELHKLSTEQKFTKPPARFTEASLVKAMEEKGIGRPATYAPTIMLLANRFYTEKEGKFLKPTELGVSVTKFLDEFFSNVINVKFTAEMENKLDQIAEENIDWKEVVAKFWESFKDLLTTAQKSQKIFKNPPQETDQICELCGANMVVREGKFGKFLGCKNYPKCQNKINIQNENGKLVEMNKQSPQVTDQVCEKCGNKMVVRKGKFGEFLGCSNYPNCKNIISLKTEVKQEGTCPICGKATIVRKTKRGKNYYACTGYPECKFMSWDLPIGKKCPSCSDGYLVVKKDEICCKECDYKESKES